MDTPDPMNTHTGSGPEPPADWPDDEASIPTEPFGRLLDRARESTDVGRALAAARRAIVDDLTSHADEVRERLDTETIVDGAGRKIREVRRPIACGGCDGSGLVSTGVVAPWGPEETAPCPDCDGVGVVHPPAHDHHDDVSGYPASDEDDEEHELTDDERALILGVGSIVGQIYGHDGRVEILGVLADVEIADTYPDGILLRVRPTGPTCTGVSASWCPVHGSCTCPAPQGQEGPHDATQCPLHDPLSDHAP